MSKFRTTATHYPILLIGLIVLAISLLTEIHFENNLTGYMDYQSAAYLVGIVEQGFANLLLILLLHRLELLREAGFTRAGEWRQVWLLWPIFAFSAINAGLAPFGRYGDSRYKQPVTIGTFCLVLYLGGIL